MCPCGSSGWPQIGHGGRPDATTRAARSTNWPRRRRRDADPEHVRSLEVVVIVLVDLARLERCPDRCRDAGIELRHGLGPARPRPRPPRSSVERDGLVVVVLGLDLDLDRVGPRLDEHPLGVGVPAERQRRRPERLDERLVERSGVGRPVGRRPSRRRRGSRARRGAGRAARRGPATWTFSRTTLTTWLALRAWRKNVRWPGSPTVPATKRSGGSK